MQDKQGERVPHREESKLMHGLIEGYIVNNWSLTPYRYSYFEKSCRKKHVHATIPKGNMGYDQYTVLGIVAVEPTFVAFL